MNGAAGMTTGGITVCGRSAVTNRAKLRQSFPLQSCRLGGIIGKRVSVPQDERGRYAETTTIRRYEEESWRSRLFWNTHTPSYAVVQDRC